MQLLIRSGLNVGIIGLKEALGGDTTLFFKIY